MQCDHPIEWCAVLDFGAEIQGLQGVPCVGWSLLVIQCPEQDLLPQVLGLARGRQAVSAFMEQFTALV